MDDRNVDWDAVWAKREAEQRKKKFDDAHLRMLEMGGGRTVHKILQGHTDDLSKEIRYLRSLVEYGAKVNKWFFTDIKASYYGTPVMYAVCKEGHLELLNALLDMHDNTNNHGSLDLGMPLCVASKEGKEEIVRRLLEHKAEVDSRSLRHPEPPLYLACEGGHAKIVNVLLEHGAEVKLKDNATAREIERERTSKSPLTCAGLFGREDIVKSLLDAGAECVCTHPSLNCTHFFEWTKLWDTTTPAIRFMLKNAGDASTRRERFLVNLLIPYQRQWARVICSYVEPRFHQAPSNKKRCVTLSNPILQLLRFFAMYPGLRKCIGGAIIKFCTCESLYWLRK